MNGLDITLISLVAALVIILLVCYIIVLIC